ncbi:hypothetical protein [Streptomyces sp. ADI91-18]|uniref:hypothetical protein n=1 Tax=Streptomyces sp. ADI91-18 TaxID=1522755 RepID=UPI000F55002D|nr:hypothetical protein [Streptomyces sp. ADI91-18]
MRSFEQSYVMFKSRIRMYLMSSTYGEVCAFIDGVDLCSGEQVMIGFRAWMIDRGTDRPELSWWLLALDGDQPQNPKLFSGSENAMAISRLFNLLDVYLSQR